MSDIEPCHPAALQQTVHLIQSDDGINVLVWPVLFLYPEHGESDFIEDLLKKPFHKIVTLIDRHPMNVLRIWLEILT